MPSRKPKIILTPARIKVLSLLAGAERGLDRQALGLKLKTPQPGAIKWASLTASAVAQVRPMIGAGWVREDYTVIHYAKDGRQQRKRQFRAYEITDEGRSALARETMPTAA